MKWQIKAFVYNFFRIIPFGTRLYRFLTVKILKNRKSEPRKWCNWFRDHITVIKRYSQKDI